MIITKIELHNWGPHVSLVADTACNVLGVIGANGKGKSNLLQAIDFGLNGNLNKQNKELYIHNFGKDGGATKASVYIEFEKNGKKGSILREITKTTTKRLLKWEDKEFKSDAEVSAQMERILGADKAAMANAIFCKQGELAKLVKGTPAVRQEIFQKLMNLAFLNSREVDLKNKIDKLKQGITDYTPLIAEAKQDIASKEEELASIALSLGSYRDRTADVTSVNAYVSAMRSVQDTLASWEKQRARVFSLKDTLSEVRSTCGDADLQETLIEKLNKEIADARSIITTYETGKQISDRLRVVQQELEEAQKALGEVGDCSDEAINQAQEEVDEAKQLCADMRKLQDLCNFVNDHTIDVLAPAQAQLEEVKEQLSSMRKQSKELDTRAESVLHEATTAIAILDCKIAYFSSTVEGELCPVCGQHMHALAALDKEKELENARKTRNEIKTKVNEINDAKAKRDALLAKAVDVETALTRKCEQAEFEINKAKNEKEALIGSKPWLSSLTVQATQDSLNHSTTVLNNLRSAATTKNTLDTKITHLNSEKVVLESAEIPEIDASIEDIKKELQDLTQERDETSARVKRIRHAEATLSAAEDSLDNLLTDKLTVLGRLAEAEDALPDDAKVALERCTTDDDKISCCRSLIETYNETTMSYSSQVGVQRKLNEQVLAKKSELETLEQKYATEKERLDLIEDLAAVRKLVSSSGLPLAYMNAVFKKVSVMVQNMLSQMGANFTVYPDKERPLTFTFVRTDTGDNYEMQQELLSGGQAIRLSLALLIACQQLILPEVGLLVLDEPSSHLDSDGIDSLRELFQKMTKIFNNSNTQLIVVDHAIAMETAFEKVIQL